MYIFKVTFYRTNILLSGQINQYGREQGIREKGAQKNEYRKNK